MSTDGVVVFITQRKAQTSDAPSSTKKKDIAVDVSVCPTPSSLLGRRDTKAVLCFVESLDKDRQHSNLSSAQRSAHSWWIGSRDTSVECEKPSTSCMPGVDDPIIGLQAAAR